MKYVALLRGINVGGNNIIKMVDLKACIEKCGCTDVQTYIQSGNVILESSEENSEKLTKKIEEALSKNFSYTALVVLKTEIQMKEIVAEVPNDWLTRSDIKCNVAFLKEPLTPRAAVSEIEVRDGVDQKCAGPEVVYMTTLIEKASQSALNKLNAKKISKQMTIRNFNTTQKIYALMHVS